MKKLKMLFLGLVFMLAPCVYVVTPAIAQISTVEQERQAQEKEKQARENEQTQQANQQSDQNAKEEKYSKWAMAGVAVLVGLVILLVIWKPWKKKSNDNTSITGSGSSSGSGIDAAILLVFLLLGSGAFSNVHALEKSKNQPAKKAAAAKTKAQASKPATSPASAADVNVSWQYGSVGACMERDDTIYFDRPFDLGGIIFNEVPWVKATVKSKTNRSAVVHIDASGCQNGTQRGGMTYGVFRPDGQGKTIKDPLYVLLDRGAQSALELMRREANSRYLTKAELKAAEKKQDSEDQARDSKLASLENRLQVLEQRPAGLSRTEVGGMIAGSEVRMRNEMAAMNEGVQRRLDALEQGQKILQQSTQDWAVASSRKLDAVATAVVCDNGGLLGSGPRRKDKRRVTYEVFGGDLAGTCKAKPDEKFDLKTGKAKGAEQNQPQTPPKAEEKQ